MIDPTIFFTEKEYIIFANNQQVSSREVKKKKKKTEALIPPGSIKADSPRVVLKLSKEKKHGGAL